MWGSNLFPLNKNTCARAVPSDISRRSTWCCKETERYQSIGKTRKACYFLKRDATLSNVLVPMEPRDTPLVDIVQALEEHWKIMIYLKWGQFSFLDESQWNEPISDFIDSIIISSCLLSATIMISSVKLRETILFIELYNHKKKTLLYFNFRKRLHRTQRKWKSERRMLKSSVKLQKMQQMVVKIWWTRVQLLTLMNSWTGKFRSANLSKHGIKTSKWVILHQFAVKSNKNNESDVKLKKPTKGYVHNVIKSCNDYGGDDREVGFFLSCMHSARISEQRHLQF